MIQPNPTPKQPTKTPTKRPEIRPQPGAQEQFLASPADLVIYGGAAGGGKSFALLLEPLRHAHVRGFTAVILRRTLTEIKKPGGIWDEAASLYPLLGGVPNQATLEYRFPSGAKIQFAGVEYDSNLPEWQSAQICLIEFDELTTFTERIFWFMLSRNRSTCGVRPYLRAGCNPDPDSFVARLLEWWLDQTTGYPIPERAGVIRWFVRISEELHWAASQAELLERFPDSLPLSLTFVPSRIQDNQILLAANPGYLANLKALPYVEQERFLLGNWKIRPAAGKVFNRAWFPIASELAIGYTGGRLCRFFDFAATKKEFAKSDPDHTASALLLACADGSFVILDISAAQIGPAQIETILSATAQADHRLAARLGLPYALRWEQEPGSAGKREAWRLTTRLAGLDALGVPSRGDKLARARGLAAQSQIGNVRLKEAPWNELFLAHMHAFPDGAHDDILDATAGAFNHLTGDSVGIYL